MHDPTDQVTYSLDDVRVASEPQSKESTPEWDRQAESLVIWNKSHNLLVVG